MTIRIVILEYCYDQQNNHWSSIIVGAYTDPTQALNVKSKIEADILPTYKELEMDCQVVIKEFEDGAIKNYSNLMPYS